MKVFDDLMKQTEAIVQLVEQEKATAEEIRETWENWKRMNASVSLERKGRLPV